jgi:hypothetical protein
VVLTFFLLVRATFSSSSGYSPTRARARARRSSCSSGRRSSSGWCCCSWRRS